MEAHILMDVHDTNYKSHEFSGDEIIHTSRNNHYKLTKTLGAGSFGIVRRAKNLETNEHVAIKILLKVALMENHVPLSKIYDELRILARVNHENIIGFKEWYESENKFYIVTEQATGGELFDRIIKKGKFTENDAIKVIYQVLKAVSYLHSNDIIHRDIKPENILYLTKNHDSRVVLADFGIAKQLSSSTQTLHTAAGSLGYVAPEVLTNEGYGKPCDIWSLGVVTYTLLSGEAAFEAKSVSSFLDDCVAHETPVSFKGYHWEHISDLAKDFILKALALDPKTRPTAKELLEHDWIVNVVENDENILFGNDPSDLRRRVKETMEIVKVKAQLEKLRRLYLKGDESDTDFDDSKSSLSTTSTDESLDGSISKLNISQEDADYDLKKSSTTKSSVETKEASDALFAQIVKAATKNKDRILTTNG